MIPADPCILKRPAEDMAWLTPECQKAIDFLNDPAYDRMAVQIIAPPRFVSS